MTYHLREAIPFQEAPAYPGYVQILAYADDFRVGAPNAYAHNEKWARYWHSSTLDILTALLQPTYYGVVSYAPGGYEIDDAAYLDALEYYRGWILQYDSQHGRWHCIVRSEEVGIDEFHRLWKLYKGE